MGTKAGNCFLDETLSKLFCKRYIIYSIWMELVAKKCMHGLAQEGDRIPSHKAHSARFKNVF